MFDWLNRQLGRPAKKQAVDETGAFAAGWKQPMEPLTTKLAAPADAGPDSRTDLSASPAGNNANGALGYVQRWPLLGPDGAVHGFELALSGTAAQHDAGSAASAPHHIALMAAARLAQGEGRQALVTLPAAALARSLVTQQVERGMWLAASDEWTDASVQQALRARGARLGAPARLSQAAAAAGNGDADTAFAVPAIAASAVAIGAGQTLDFVLLRADAGGLDGLLAEGERWRRLRPKLPLVATGVADVSEIERLLRAGFTLVGGRLGGRTAARAGGGAAKSTQGARSKPLALEPNTARLMGLINHLAQDCDNVVIARAARQDVALSYRLLRYANSPAVGLRHSVDSIDQALSLLGRNEFRRWLQVMLLATGSTRPASMALQEDALARARLFESLARHRGEPATDALFTLGLLSQLDLLLQVPLAEALEPLRLPENTRAALLDRRGDWASYLSLADELEQDDETRLDQAATAFGGAAAVLAQAQSAWTWAARVMASQQAPATAKRQNQAVPA